MSQWLLTKEVVTKAEIVSSLVGRLALGFATAGVVCVIGLVGAFEISTSTTLVLAVAQVLSVGQMAFAWELQRGRQTVAGGYALAEFAIPAMLAAFFSNPTSAVTAVILAKTCMGLILTFWSLRRFPIANEAQGLGPRAFGVHSAAWALTSVASGTGELMLLTGSATTSQVGLYRIFQTLASLGSVVGFTALAPLMRQRGGRRANILKTSMVLGALASTLLVGGYLFAFVFLVGDSLSVDTSWLVFVAVVLGASAVLSTMAIVPVAEVARVHGSRYISVIGLCSAASYWVSIALLGYLDAALFSPLAVLLASAVGILGNFAAVRHSAHVETDGKVANIQDEYGELNGSRSVR
ncbi:hypothetical protein QEN35_21635 [Gordonia alkanivorans]|uniref:hypothetical protein n=1 Tax=Gordonia alkanivorans TaxID=84096 RepID=UPI002448DB68|nr:hypothetical protein [Gordonia alkanivorans]MDH3026961.1 hypothetical protein [Gordonia alkanivorans]